MAPRPQLAPDEQMTIEEFLAFTASRPDEERWELIDGVPVLNASPVEFHQIVIGNVLSWLLAEKGRHRVRAGSPSWEWAHWCQHRLTACLSRTCS